MKGGYGISEALLRRRIEEVIETRAPERLDLLRQLDAKSLSRDDANALRELLTDELVENGLGPDDEPNSLGHEIEAAIDWLGRVAAAAP